MIDKIITLGQLSDFQQDSVYHTGGVCPTLKARDYKDAVKIMEEPKIIDDTYENREPRAYGDVAPSIRAERDGFKVCAMRGRNPDNPTSRQPGLPLEQMIEVAENGEISNTITSVYKDNMLLENLYDVYNDRLRTDGCSGTKTQTCTGKGSGVQYTFEDMTEEPIKVRQATEKGYIECEPGGIADLSFPDSENRRARAQEGGRVSPALTCAGIAGLTRLESRYRIRKLTEKECWRLMGFTDEEFDKAASVNSRSQLYKQAGNSIVVDVLVALFTEVVGSIGTVNTHSGEQINLFDLLD